MVKKSLIIIYFFAFIGLITFGNLAHESYHYFSVRSQPNTTVEKFCVLAMPIPEDNYSEAGYVEFHYTGKEPFSPEWIAVPIGYSTLIISMFLYGYFRLKEEKDNNIFKKE